MSNTPQTPEDEKRRDEILKRMLKTPPKPHNESKTKPKKDTSGAGKNRDSE